MDNSKASPSGAPSRTGAPAAGPFSYPAFTVLWIATVLSNIGTWMHDVGAGWLMTSLAPSPAWVALVQTATSLPVFLLALPAGALADILDRRKMLLAVQIVMALVAAGLGVVVLLGAATPVLLLLFTFAMGVGAAITAPAWQAIVPSLVPRQALQQAVATNSVGINISRAIGPALAGFIISGIGVAAPFLINAVSFLAVVAALAWWRPPAPAGRRLPTEDLLGAMRAGVRFAWHSQALKATLARAAAFFLFASAYWAMLPLIVRQVLAGGAQLYGVLLGCVGVGAVLGALGLGRLRQRLGPDSVVALGTMGTVVALLLFATIHNPVAAGVASLVAGASWIAVLTTLNVSAQTSLPEWVRARGLSIFVTVFFGSMSAGSIVWGQTATHFGISAALLIASAGAVLAIALTWRYKLQQGDSSQLAPSMHWPAPTVSDEVAHDRGPVLITIEYQVRPENAARFVATLDELSQARLRDGAFSWGLFEDAAQPGRYVECFQVVSWLEHLRQHERVTLHDRDVQERALAFHSGAQPPVVSHFIAPQTPPAA
ncbi:MFS transporter [Cupriavidus pinatubonensis]|uniref:MFS transporter n=1 Tax=Cupriavidus pinatubonensis TaxID=248026 RepID=UPI0011260E48|nr:MFS transporter [Cupriavidus pinatubonensis]TPQ31634.1 MFS transporter [Cupriavidus pinatubonensis]